MELALKALLGGLLGGALLLYFTRFYYRDLLFGPPVDFDEDEHIEIGLYPNGHRAAVVFTCDDLHGATPSEKLTEVLKILENRGVKGTFFVTPYFQGRYLLTKESPIAELLKEAEERGHEIALHGLTHSSPRRAFSSLRKARELGNLPYSEQRRRIKKGRRILEAAGFSIRGFRSPSFSGSFETLRILDREEFLYSSDTRIYPFLLMSNKRFCESIYYPYHPGGLGLLDITSNGDYFWGYSSLGKEDFRRLMHRFDRFYQARGVFVLLSHIDSLTSGKSLTILDRFLEAIQEKGLWKPTLRELAEWWLAREVLFATTEIREGVLYVTLEKGSEFPLHGLAIRFRKGAPAENYKIVDVNGVLLKEGETSEGTVLVDL
jgi:peptidoglycan/xylan/chitin deacetylase (PgdA/CDA1 family)